MLRTSTYKLYLTSNEKYTMYATFLILLNAVSKASLKLWSITEEMVCHHLCSIATGY